MNTINAEHEKARKQENSMDKALAELNTRIADGEEFPDAIWVVCKRHKVDHDALRDAYDDDCLDRSRVAHHPAAVVA
jgi:hypothetical protein